MKRQLSEVQANLGCAHRCLRVTNVTRFLVGGMDYVPRATIWVR
jgi:hypothetical protein